MIRFLNNKVFQALLLIGLPLGHATGQSGGKPTGPPAPDETRFQKVELAANLDEPMELAVLPDGKVLFIERKGAVKLYDPASGTVKVANVLHVFHELEDGLLGLALDPEFAKNRYVYLYYSPPGEKPLQRVSRFRMKDEELDLASERTIIEIPTQRTECCHSAGSLAFGPNRTLYIAVGDNTNPHNPGYFNSIDERPGREFWDAQRTAGNTHDLRGKILRIRPTEVDGGAGGAAYSIPEGNLFPPDGSRGKPEIYAMGCRNPYRIAVDPKTGYLYWGDVGQNTEDNPARGPISYDEFHQAKVAGFFGWPYFAGDNQPYADYDFETGKIGPFFDPQHPVNDSKNNTGSRELPPAQPAFIWYSYDESKVFNHLGTGGKSPIVGPVYYADQYPASTGSDGGPRRFPDYYSGKLFIAEWMRDWINVVTMDESGRLQTIERFMPSTAFDHPIDLDFGPDGALYVLEYGTFWFAQNKNARLIRVEYHEGNRAPVARATASKTSGAAPLTVILSAKKSFDHDPGDALTYQWRFSDSPGAKATGITAQHTFIKPGIYRIKLTVTDRRGGSATDEITVEVGNETPQVDVVVTGNQSFYWPNKPVPYQVKVRDREDGSLADGRIAPQDVVVTLERADMGTDLTFLAQRQAQTAGNYFHPGLELLQKSDCRSCHHAEEKSVGPSYRQVAQRYRDDAGAVETLSAKIIRGGNGNWGETAMSAHPQLKKEEAAEIVRYILSLNQAPEIKNQVPVKGRFTPDEGADGSYIFAVTYRDKGGKEAGPQTAKKYVRLRNARMKAISCDDYRDAVKYNDRLIKFTKTGAYILFRDLDLTGLRKATCRISSRFPGKLELRLRSAAGPLLGTMETDPTTSAQKRPDATTVDAVWQEIPVNLNPPPASGRQDLYVVFRAPDKSEANQFVTFDLDWIYFE